jgi:CMP-N-acetylneuraminic acid synthetase
LNYYDETGSRIIARQQLGKLYHRNGVAYAISRECVLMQSSIKGERTGAVIIEGQHISIDTPWDLALVDFILARKN